MPAGLQLALVVQSGSHGRDTQCGVQVRATAGIFHPFASLCFQCIIVPGSLVSHLKWMNSSKYKGYAHVQNVKGVWRQMHFIIT